MKLFNIFNGLTVSLVAICMPSAVYAQGDDARYSVGLTAGTLGIGPEVGYRIDPMFGVRGSATFLGVSHDFDVNDITYNGKLKLSSFGLNADLYPFKGGFRLSAGFRIDKNKVQMRATPANSVSIGNTTYTPAQIGTLSGNVRAKDFAPTLTLGYAGGLSKGIKFGVDAGAMFQGSPRIKDLKATGTLASNPAFLTDIAVEQTKVDDEIDKYKVYPIIQFSLSYAF
jgi:hypothetical protein